MKSPEVQNKLKISIQEKYGVDHICKSSVVKAKIKSTNLERYGFTNATLNEKVRAKIAKTTKDKYGVEHISQSSEIQEKSKQTRVERYGEDIFRKRMLHTENANKEYIEEHFVENGFLLFDKMLEYFGVCESFGFKLKRSTEVLTPNETRLKAQKEIYDFLLDKCTNLRFNEKALIAPKELDIYAPDQKFAIEYDGLMYHSFGAAKNSTFNTQNLESVKKLQHLNKTESCEKLGVKLFHIFENEWNNPVKQEIWKSVLESVS